MTETIKHARRVISAADAGKLVGEPVADTAPNLPSPRTADDQTTIIDPDLGQVIGIITKLPPEWVQQLRRAVTGMEMGTVARMGNHMAGGGRTFGWAPKRIVNGRESCRAAMAASEYPTEHETLSALSAYLTAQFDRLLPDRAAADQNVLQGILEDWRMEEGSLWTSGVINKSATLPYHRDGMNFHTWSAMPSLRYGMAGGNLHLPEYDITYPVRDGEVTWFCGKDLVHGVTPMAHKRKAKNPYRYSVVYYALSGMKDCRTFAEETASSANRRTERERRMAAEVRQRIEAAREGTP